MADGAMIPGDREFWLAVRRGCLDIAAAIERRYLARERANGRDLIGSDTFLMRRASMGAEDHGLASGPAANPPPEPDR